MSQCCLCDQPAANMSALCQAHGQQLIAVARWRKAWHLLFGLPTYKPPAFVCFRQSAKRKRGAP